MAIERVLAETLTFALHALLSFYPKTSSFQYVAESSPCERNTHGLLASLNGRRAISCEVPIGSRAEFSRHRACPVVVQSYMAAFYL